MDIKPIVNGETMESVRLKINALIAAYNSSFPITASYLDLNDKPKIDGIELLPSTAMSQFDIPVASLPNTLDLQALFIQIAKDQAEIIARAVALDEIAKAFSMADLPFANTLIADDMIIPIYVPRNDGTLGLYKTTMKDVTNKAVWAANKFEASIEEETLLVPME